MTKRDVIDRIMDANPSADPAFLAAFDCEDLLAYLRKLDTLAAPRLGQRAGLKASVAPTPLDEELLNQAGQMTPKEAEPVLAEETDDALLWEVDSPAEPAEVAPCPAAQAAPTHEPSNLERVAHEAAATETHPPVDRPSPFRPVGLYLPVPAAVDEDEDDEDDVVEVDEIVSYLDTQIDGSGPDDTADDGTADAGDDELDQVEADADADQMAWMF